MKVKGIFNVFIRSKIKKNIIKFKENYKFRTY